MLQDGQITLKGYHIVKVRINTTPRNTVMSQSDIARFPHHPFKPKENDPDAAHHARRRIAALPETYLNHAGTKKEDLVGVKPVSPATDKTARAIPLVQGVTSEVMIPESARATPTVSQQFASAGAAVQPPPAPLAMAAMPVPAPAINPLESGASAPAAPLPTTTTSQSYEDEPQSKYRLPSPVRPLVTAAGIFVLLLVVFKAPILLSQLSYLTQPKSPATTATQASTEVGANPIISIPKINVSAPISFPTTTADAPNYDPELENGVVHLPDTALPGQIGNTVIFGHSSNDWWEPGNYKFVFVLLDKLQVGDTFSINYNSTQYIYQVTSTEVVDPTDISIVGPTTDAEATIFTCTPPGTSWKRFVVHAKQISPTPTTATAKASTSAQTDGTLPSNAPGLTTDIGNWWSSIVHALGFGGGSSNSSSNSSAVPSGTLPAQ
jgi:LPXTG-site transpeptidase (sortase) family protein